MNRSQTMRLLWLVLALELAACVLMVRDEQALWLLADDDVKAVRDDALSGLDRLGGEDIRSWALQRAASPKWEHRLDAAVRLQEYDGEDVA